MGQNCHDEAQRSDIRACRFGYDLMKRPAGKAAFGQVRIERGQTEGQDCVRSLCVPVPLRRQQ